METSTRARRKRRTRRRDKFSYKAAIGCRARLIHRIHLSVSAIIRDGCVSSVLSARAVASSAVTRLALFPANRSAGSRAK